MKEVERDSCDILMTYIGEPYKFDVREKDRAYNEGLYDMLIGKPIMVCN